jgi:uncharacterized protein YbcV (DUF1398 family)
LKFIFKLKGGFTKNKLTKYIRYSQAGVMHIYIADDKVLLISGTKAAF